MIRSMTAFASGERVTPWGVLGCELRSVNHRFLETGLRLSDDLRALEPQLREKVAARVQRGKLDLAMRLRAPEAATGLAVNEALLEQLGALAQRLDPKFPRLRVEFFKPPAFSTGVAGGEVSFTRSGQKAENTGATLLEQAEAAGLTPEFGCRMGICFSCTKTKTDGTVRNVLTGEESSLPDEEIRICVSAPVGDYSVEL